MNILRSGKGKLALVLAVVLVLVIVYAAIMAFWRLPENKVNLSQVATQSVVASGNELDKVLHSSVGGNGVLIVDPAIDNGEDVTSRVFVSDEKEYSLASISKLITVLVCAEKMPLNPGEQGPKYKISEKDAEITKAEQEKNSVVAALNPGTELTQRQMLDTILLHSAGDTTIEYARWVFGSDQQFIDAANQWLQKHNMTHTKIVEPTGIAAENKSTMRETLELSYLSLRNPTIAEIVKTKDADIPGLGKIHNRNPLVQDGMAIGVKTGTLDDDYRNLASASDFDVSGHKMRVFSVTMAKHTDQDRAADTIKLVESAEKSSHKQKLLEPHTVLGTVTGPDGKTVDLISGNNEPLETAMFPGESAKVNTVMQAEIAGTTGKEIGRVTITSPHEVKDVPVALSTELPEPGFWWRISHPLDVLGVAGK